MKHFVKILFGFLHYDIPYIAKRTIPNHAKTRFRCIEVTLQNWQIVMNFSTLIISNNHSSPFTIYWLSWHQ